MRDKYLIPGPGGVPRFCQLRDAVWWCLRQVGYQVLVAGDADGLNVVGAEGSPTGCEAEALGKELLGRQLGPGSRSLAALSEAIVPSSSRPGGNLPGCCSSTPPG